MTRSPPRSLLALALLVAAGGRAAAQSLAFPEGLQAWRFNPLLVTGLDPAPGRALTVTGRRWDGREVALFRGPGVGEERGLRCWVYLDGDIQSLEVRDRYAAPLAAPVRFGAPEVVVCGLPPPELGPGYLPVDDPRSLGPGDVRVLPAGAGDAEPLRAAGIHVLLLGGRRPPFTEQPPSAWRGRLLSAEEPSAAGVLLARERERLAEFKERCLRLVSEGGFYGRRHPRAEVRALAFPSSRPADAAYSLQREELAVRVGGPLGWALLAFYVPALAAAAFGRRRGAALLLAGALLAGFVLFTALRPGQARALTVEFLPPEPGLASADIRLQPLEPAPGPGVRRAYRQEGAAAEGLRLVYRAASAPGGELPLTPFLGEPLVRFNQVPEVRQREGRLLLVFRDPLAAWSLHAPR